MFPVCDFVQFTDNKNCFFLINTLIGKFTLFLRNGFNETEQLFRQTIKKSF